MIRVDPEATGCTRLLERMLIAKHGWQEADDDTLKLGARTLRREARSPNGRPPGGQPQAPI